ncbi:DUF308 domain-containing protein [Rhodospirillaceae bacterium SYSU D60014]|uniref:HdeD family acid-resistance protein n=1 Tax=Virgifigura deserti TaxID=2268457 RepID=UPI000E6712FB
MDTSISRYWWLVLLQGIAAVIFGILAFVWPAVTLGVLILFYGVLAIVYGVSALISAFSARRVFRLWWLEAIAGIAALIAGVLAFFWPGITALALLYLFAAWALVIGIFELAAAFRSGFPSELRWAFGLAGAASVLVGTLLITMSPAGGLLALVWLVGLYALFDGVLWIFRAFRLRSLYHEGLDREHGGALPA